MKESRDEEEYMEAYLDTPFPNAAYDKREKAADRADDLLDLPGVCLKRRGTGLPWKSNDFGKLVKYDTNLDQVVVRSRPPGDRIVWTGSVEEYVCMWTVD